MNPVFIAFIAIGIAVLCIILAIRFGKHFFQVFGIMLFLVLVTSIIFGAIAINDAISLKETLSEKSNLFILKDGNELLSAIMLKPPIKRTAGDLYQESVYNFSEDDDFYEHVNLKSQEEIKLTKQFIFISPGEFSSLSDYYSIGNYTSMIKSNYMFIFDKSVFEMKENSTINLGVYELSIKDALEIIESVDPSSKLSSILINKYNLLIQDADIIISDYSDIKSVMFILITQSIIGNNIDENILFELVKSEVISVYPETLVFKTLKLLPSYSIDMVINRMEKKINETQVLEEE